MHTKRMTTRYLVTAAVIAALYAVLTLAFAPLSYGEIQVRISEALTVLPLFTPAAVPGLFIGCLAANVYTMNPFDIIFGSLATLIAAYLTWKSRRMPWLAMLWPVVCNGVIIGPVLRFAYAVPLPLWLCMLSVAAGELVAVYVLGGVLQVALRKGQGRLFGEESK